ncbi:hypothetical protein [Ruminococcus albus]|uniref:hypothetical protein n=1 Tax=Ruminococcus albus TaxID=1264 RepID=UPI0005B8212D|nr:hypothetical protein [Ruminococcus albus]
MSEPNMTSEIVSLRNENAVLKEELALANQQLAWFRKQIFGRKTEQTSVVMEKEFGVQLSMFGNNEEKSAAKICRNNYCSRTQAQEKTHSR